MEIESVDLSFDSVVQEAIDDTGLKDFGGLDFEKPLRHLITGLNDEANLNAMGRMIQRSRIVGILKTNLLFEQYWNKYPEISQEIIRKPLVIVGLGRTGTTLLQRLLAADDRFFSNAWWEVRFPVPFPGESIDNPEKRIKAALEEVQQMYDTVPNLGAMHPLDAMQPDEEILLLEQSFYSTTPESFANLPRFSEWLDSQDQTPGYEHLKRMLQFLQWQKRQRGIDGDRWILKSPHHIHYTDILLKVFPDCKIVQTHRDPLVVIPSWASLNFSLWQQNCDTADPIAAGSHWGDKMAEGMKRCMAVRDKSNQGTFFDIDYKETAKDPLSVAAKIYDFLGWELDARSIGRLQNWLDTNDRSMRPLHEYTLDKFGYTEEELKQKYHAYRERFIL